MELDLDDPGILLREDVLDDPRAFYDLLRRVAPVWQIPRQNSFLVSEPSLIREAVGRPEDFSSNLVSLLHNDGNGCPVAFAMAPYRDPIHVLSTADPPLHTRHRKLLQPHLNPGAVAALETTVTAIVDDHLSPMLAEPRVEFVRAFSDPVPMRTIGEVIGLPAADASKLIDLVTRTGALLDGVTDTSQMHDAMSCALDLTVYVHEQLRATLALPKDARRGLLAVFAEAVDAGTVGAGEVRDMLVVLVSAGSETTASLIATAIELLARDPDLQARLRRDPSLIPAAIEGVLRTDGPFQFHYRWAPHGTTLGGIDIPAESRVLLMWAAANRATPQTIDAGSDEIGDAGPATHFAFGKGAHFCIGAPIARLEARIALTQLLARTQRFALDPDHPPTRRPSIFIRRHASLHLDVDWADAGSA
jgi:cytochrome P450